VNDTSMLARLLATVRRRAIYQLALEQGSIALAIGFGGVIVLLLAGTQILDWYWPALLLVATFAIGMWRIRGRVPSHYQVAQAVDQGRGFEASFSPAVFFSGGSEGPHAPRELVEAQRNRAEHMATTADSGIAWPLSLPQQAWVCLALLGISATLVVVRYGYR